jgi:nucleoside-diphosphate-sugar epimerase
MRDEEKSKNRPSDLPVLVVTGASGFIGRHLLPSFYNDFYIYALARSSQKYAGIKMHKNINWVRVDIGEKKSVEKVFTYIARNGGADYVIHLAGYYDFDGKDSKEYERTNVNGTHYILNSSKLFKLKRFIFASSLTVTDFKEPGLIINEKSPCDATFNYAVSKKKGEELVNRYSDQFPVAIVRLAAIYSDWCEYGPLYYFLKTWLEKNWRSNILAGKGEAAVPYLHVKNLNTLFYKIIIQTKKLPKCDIYMASPDGCTSQKELYDIAVRYNLGRRKNPIFFPKWFTYLGVLLLDRAGVIIGKRPFERPWMIQYVDFKLNVDASYTHKKLNWTLNPRFDIRRRLLFLIEHMKSEPYEWHRKNLESIDRRKKINPNLKIYDAMDAVEESVIAQILKAMYSDEFNTRFKQYRALKIDINQERILFIYSMIKTAVRTGDRIHVLSYARNLSSERYKEGFDVSEVIDAVQLVGDYIVKTLVKLPELTELPEYLDMDQRIYDGITLTIQLIVDELEDSFDKLYNRYGYLHKNERYR